MGGPETRSGDEGDHEDDHDPYLPPSGDEGTDDDDDDGTQAVQQQQPTVIRDFKWSLGDLIQQRQTFLGPSLMMAFLLTS